RVAPPAHPIDERPGEVQPGTQAQDEGRSDLPEPGSLPPARDRPMRRAERGVARRPRLPRHEQTRRRRTRRHRGRGGHHHGGITPTGPRTWRRSESPKATGLYWHIRRTGYSLRQRWITVYRSMTPWQSTLPRLSKNHVPW